jgi:hypothetical protein
VCIRYRGNVSPEPLPNNDRGTFTEPLPSNDKGIFTEPLPNNDKGILTEPLPSNDRGIHTHRQQRDLISLLCFLNKECRLKMCHTIVKKLILNGRIWLRTGTRGGLL